MAVAAVAVAVVVAAVVAVAVVVDKAFRAVCRTACGPCFEEAVLLA
jgi:hypothetical protein